MSKYLITGTAGFIGFHVVNSLINRGEEIIGLDNINDYYDTGLKYSRLREAGIETEDIEWNRIAQSKKWPGYRFIRMDIQDSERLMNIFRTEKFDYVIHLAAQAGVRYSLENPGAYIQSNIVGFLNILEACRHYNVSYLLYASSSSVYGNNKKVPFSEDDNVDNPISLYAATKKSNELMAFTYNYLYNISSTGLRFFTVYGPWGRPDMAVYKFTESILKNNTVQIYGDGNFLRDFTYIDDIVNGLISVLDTINIKTPPSLMNIGNNKPVNVKTLVSVIENTLDRKAKIENIPLQPGDVERTFADISRINAYCGFKPTTPLEDGIRKFCDWFTDFYS